jgi:hypothetical protein
MADTGIDAVKRQRNAEYAKQYRMKRKLLLQQQTSTSSETQLAEKQKKAEYDKQYRLKRKLLIQQQASTSSEIELVRKKKKKKVNLYLPSLRMKVPDHVYVLGHSYTCHTLIKYNRYA